MDTPEELLTVPLAQRTLALNNDEVFSTIIVNQWTEAEVLVEVDQVDLKRMRSIRFSF